MIGWLDKRGSQLLIKGTACFRDYKKRAPGNLRTMSPPWDACICINTCAKLMTIIRMREIGACYRKYFPETIKKCYSIQ